MGKKRAVVLYRMSTDRQDLDTQKRVNRNFCKENDFEIIDEFFEDGVSGYKNPLGKRPDLIAILNKAERREFDVFVVYILDRIVRREEEYPLIINHLTINGVEIYAASTKERVKVEHTDKLTNYITGWNNEYESIKTSMRVKDAMRSKNELGKYMGGVPPYGYEIYKTGEINSKGKMVSDIRIKTGEVEVLKTIFDLYVNKNYGSNSLTRLLNEMGYKSRNGTPFRENSVRRILRNPTCIGRRPYNRTQSSRDKVVENDIKDWKLQPYRDDLRIIDDDTFYKAQIILNSRGNTGIKNTPRNSKQLFSGLVYCGYCGNKLRTDYTIKKQYRKNGTYHKTIAGRFDCKSHKLGQTGIKHEQKSFGVVKYQKAALEIIYNFISNQVDKKMFLENINKHKITNINDVSNQIKELEQSVSDLSKLVQKLELQIDNAIMEDDIKKVDILTRRIESSELKIQEGRLKINQLNSELNSNKVKNSNLTDTYNMLDNWIDRFESGDDAIRKSMLLKIVDKIYLHKTNVRVILKLEIASSISNPFNIGSQQMVEGTIPNGMGGETHDQNYHWVKDTIPSGMGSKTLYSEQDKYFYITLSHEVA